MKKTARERKRDQIAKLDELTPDQRAALLDKAWIGHASQARALGSAFRMLEKAVQAEDEIRVGKGGNGRLVRRPNWPVRIAASRTLLEWLAPVVKRSAAGPSGRTVVNVVTPGYARGVQHAEAIVLDVTHEVLDAPSESDSDAG